MFLSGVTYVEGTEGLPAFTIAKFANLRSPSRLVVPEKLGKNVYNKTSNKSLKQISLTDEFAIMASMRANKPPDGYLFAIVNSLETVVQLGLKVSLTNNNNLNVSLVYNDPATQTPSDSLVSFTLPYEPKLWIDFAMQVMNDRVILYHNCLKVQEANISKEPKELIFESASTFYLAQAGISGGSKHKFEVS